MKTGEVEFVLSKDDIEQLFRGYQLIKWFPEWVGIGKVKATQAIALIYDWYFFLGFWEIRKWHTLKDGDIEKYNKTKGWRFN